MGLGLIHYIPLVAYFGFWIMCIVSLTGRPLLGLYYMIPFRPVSHDAGPFLDYPLGANVLTILVIAVIIGALIQGKRLPKSKLYFIWLIFGIYLYLSMWYGTALGNAPPPLWITDLNFATWKDYMLIPLMFVAAGLVVEDRKAVRTVILITAFSLLFIDRSCLLESMSRTWATFDENKRSGGPLGYRLESDRGISRSVRHVFLGLRAVCKKEESTSCSVMDWSRLTIFATMYTFSRGAYLAIIVSVFVLGVLKDRKLLVVGRVFLLTWQLVVPTAVRQRIKMTRILQWPTRGLCQ